MLCRFGETKQTMKKIIAKLIHWVSPKFFERKTYWYLHTWGIQDIRKGKIVWNKQY